MGNSVRRASLWLTVAGITVITPVLLNVAADRFPQAKGPTTLVDYMYRRNG